MILKPARNHAHNSRGMSLLETLLAVGVSASFFLFIIGIGRIIATEQGIQAAAAYVEKIDIALDDLLSNPDRFNDVYSAVDAAGGVDEIDVADIRDGGYAGMPASPLLGTSFPDQGPFDQTYKIVLRIADDPLISTDPPSLETHIISENLIEDSLALRIAGALGGRGGALRDSPAVAGSLIEGAYGAWSTPTNDLVGSPWYVAVTAVTADPPTIDNGGYVVAYHYYDLNRISKDYLYRVNTVPPVLNRMESDLSLNSYNVIGADNIATTGQISSEQVIVNGGVNIARTTGTGVLAPPADSAVRLIGNVQADGPSSIGGNIAMFTANGRLSAADGNVVVSFSGNGDNAITINRNAVFSDTLTTAGLITRELTADNVNLGAGGTFNASASNGINASGRLVVGGATTITSRPGIDGTLSASDIETNNLTVTAGNVGAIDMKVTGTYDHGNGSTNTNRYTGVEGLNEIDDDPDWRCGSGCGE